MPSNHSRDRGPRAFSRIPAAGASSEGWRLFSLARDSGLAASPSASRSAARGDAARGALLGTFVGDALGMPYEGCAPDQVPGQVEMVDARLGRGTYTDDTQMMIALADSLVACGGVSEEHLARSFLERFEPSRGYGAGTLQVFELWRAGISPTIAAQQIFGKQGSLGNGAAMRIAPIGVRFADDASALAVQATRSARITHAHPLGVEAAVVQAAAVAAAVRGDDILASARRQALSSELAGALGRIDGLLRERSAAATVAAMLGNSSEGFRSVPASLYSALAHADFESAVSFAVRCGGDTDTIAAMAGAVAGAHFGATAIPDRWLDTLEDGSYGRSYVERIADLLHEQARPPHAA